MNIKKGDVLKYRDEWNGSVTILAIIDDLYFTSRTGNKTGGEDFYTLEGLKEAFELPEEKWVPKETLNGKSEFQIASWIAEYSYKKANPDGKFNEPPSIVYEQVEKDFRKFLQA